MAVIHYLVIHIGDEDSDGGMVGVADARNIKRFENLTRRGTVELENESLTFVGRTDDAGLTMVRSTIVDILDSHLKGIGITNASIMILDYDTIARAYGVANSVIGGLGHLWKMNGATLDEIAEVMERIRRG